MKFKSLLIVLALFFSDLNCMQKGDTDNKQNQENPQIEQKAGSSKQQKSLVDTVAHFLACKLIDDIKLEIEGEKEVSYKDFLTSRLINEDVKRIILKSLVKDKSELLWKTLPVTITQQNLGIEFRDIIVLNNDQLLVLNDESHESTSNKISKIKVWDMRTQDWVNTEIKLPEISIHKMLISKDLKTLVVWTLRDDLLIYDLAENKEISRITSGTNVIRSVCLFNDDQLVCCGIGNGQVRIFDKDTAEEVFSFKTAGSAIRLLDAIDDVIVTVDYSHIKSWKLDMNEGCNVAKCKPISRVHYSDHIEDLKLAIDGKTLILNLRIADEYFMRFYKFSEPGIVRGCQPYYPSFAGLKRSQDGKMLFAGEAQSSTFFGSYWDKFDFLRLLDAESGAVIRRFNFGEDITLFADDKSNIKWKGFAVSPDNSFIVLYDKQGQIAKISLNLDEGLESILEKIKLGLVEKKTASQSRCLVS